MCPPASPKSRAAERQRLCPGVGPGTLSLPRRRANTSVLGCPLHTRLYDDLVRPSQLLLLRGGWQLEGAEPIIGPDPGAESAGAVATVASSPCPLPPSLVTVPSPVREEGSCHRDPSLDTERSADRVPRRGSLPSPLLLPLPQPGPQEAGPRQCPSGCWAGRVHPWDQMRWVIYHPRCEGSPGLAVASKLGHGACAARPPCVSLPRGAGTRPLPPVPAAGSSGSCPHSRSHSQRGSCQERFPSRPEARSNSQ